MQTLDLVQNQGNLDIPHSLIQINERHHLVEPT